jgi:hypothetical protein
VRRDWPAAAKRRLSLAWGGALGIGTKGESALKVQDWSSESRIELIFQETQRNLLAIEYRLIRTFSAISLFLAYLGLRPLGYLETPLRGYNRLRHQSPITFHLSRPKILPTGR